MLFCWLSVSPCLNLPSTYTREQIRSDPSTYETASCCITYWKIYQLPSLRCETRVPPGEITSDAASQSGVKSVLLTVYSWKSQMYLQGVYDNMWHSVQIGKKTVNGRKKGRKIKSNRGRITVCKMCFHLRLHLNEMLSNKNLSLPTVVSFAPHNTPRLWQYASLSWITIITPFPRSITSSLRHPLPLESFHFTVCSPGMPWKHNFSKCIFTLFFFFCDEMEVRTFKFVP